MAFSQSSRVQHSNEIEQIEVALGHPKTNVTFTLPSVPESPNEEPLAEPVHQSGEEPQEMVSTAAPPAQEPSPQTPLFLDELVETETAEQNEPMDLGGGFIF